MLDRIGNALIKALMLGASGIQPPSSLSQICETMFQFQNLFPEATKIGLVTCLQQPNFPNSNISADDKKQLMQLLISTRKLKVVHQVLKDFGVHCKGLKNTAYSQIIA